jgi:CBS domain-containing protein
MHASGPMPTVRSVMERAPACCTAALGVVECAQIMERVGASLLPVVESMASRKLVGVVTDRDLALGVVGEGRDPRECTVEECMTDELYTVGPDEELDRALEIMERQRIRRLPVVDEQGACVGLLGWRRAARVGRRP